MAIPTYAAPETPPQQAESSHAQRNLRFDPVTRVSGPFALHAAANFGDRTVSNAAARATACLLYTSPSPRDKRQSRMPSSA